MKNTIDRRRFIKTTAAAGAAMSVAAGAPFARTSPSDKILVSVMGVNGRGHELARSFAAQPNSEVLYVCDVDSRAVEKTTAAVAEIQGKRPDGALDFRSTLDDADLDALVIAAPDHWHAPAAVLALKAGKHVYVEKPCGHNPAEGELLVAAQKKYDRVVQMGSQQRSGPVTIDVIDFVRGGGVGRAYMARTWYANKRGPIGHGNTHPFQNGSTTSSGRDLHLERPTETTSFTTTGTGSGVGGPESPATTERTKSILLAGRWMLISPYAYSRVAADIITTTTGSSSIRRCLRTTSRTTKRSRGGSELQPLSYSRQRPRNVHSRYGRHGHSRPQRVPGL